MPKPPSDRAGRLVCWIALFGAADAGCGDRQGTNFRQIVPRDVVQGAFGGSFPTSRPQGDERLSFQAQGRWTPRVALNADVAMVYGIDRSLPERLATWKAKGYIPHVMTGVAWGEYQEYMFGQWDGKSHMGEAQQEKNGHQIAHGKDVWYMSPSITYGQFLCVGVKRALDAGAEAIHLEEPEFWARAGYSEGFKREWQSYYHEPWQAPHESVDGQWRASKLKYFLYRRALQQVFSQD